MTRYKWYSYPHRQQIVDQLLQEEKTPDGYRLIKEKPEYNAFVLHKEDLENPIFRVDMLIDKVTPKQIYEVLKD